MSEIDEGLDEIFHDRSIKTGGELVIPYFRWGSTKQAILDLICKHRGCEPIKNIVTVGEGIGLIKKGPCKWCGKEQP